MGDDAIAAQTEEYPENSPVVELIEDELVDELAQSERRRETDLIAQLRLEANDLKECFTRYSFQAISICSIAGAGILHFMVREPIVGLGNVAILLIMLVVCRLGTFKYGAANRHFGYELYLKQTRDIPADFCGRWKPEYRKMDWEEAMRAWRVVQPTLFERVLKKGDLLRRERYRNGFEPSSHNPMWYAQHSLFGIGSAARWHSGTYLRTMLVFLHFLACSAVLLLWFTVLLVEMNDGQVEVVAGNHLIVLGGKIEYFGLHTTILMLFVAAITLVATIFTYIRVRCDRMRCRILEDGFLSIHSCAIVWQAVITAHHIALEKCRHYKLTSDQMINIMRHLPRSERKDALAGNAEKYIAREQKRRAFVFHPDGVGMTGYSFWLSQEAVSLRNCAKDIHSWIALRQCGGKGAKTPQNA
jgi:hypothetical protein